MIPSTKFKLPIPLGSEVLLQTQALKSHFENLHTEIASLSLAERKDQEIWKKFYHPTEITAVYGLKHRVKKYETTGKAIADASNKQLGKIKENLTILLECTRDIQKLLEEGNASENSGSDNYSYESVDGNQSNEDTIVNIYDDNSIVSEEGSIEEANALQYTPPIAIQFPTNTAESNNYFLQKIYQLNEIVRLLETDDSMAGFNKAIECLESLKPKDLAAQQAKLDRALADRPCFHLYKIHLNEHPETMANDLEYGTHAMQGEYVTTNEERCRALRHTVVELALGALEEAIDCRNGDTIKTVLQLLEETKMDPKDLPEGTQNLAYILFGHMYHCHCKARETKSTLVDPDHSRFHSDFGRNAFYCHDEILVSLETQREAVKLLHENLKTVWESKK